PGCYSRPGAAITTRAVTTTTARVATSSARAAITTRAVTTTTAREATNSAKGAITTRTASSKEAVLYRVREKALRRDPNGWNTICLYPTQMNKFV
ncbi:hypothetical protein, partial [uncultured Muribaculum sp.]|uniref:hypothetical protein n=1 Tax=uncultured Muribaculum sp. TaxID=1918613 RepID=UPI00266F948A